MRQDAEGRGGGSGQQGERVEVARADDGEVPPVQGRDLAEAEAFGDRDDGGVDGPERQVGVLGDEVGGAGVVGEVQVDNLELAAAEGGQERGLGLGAAAGNEQLADLDDDRGGNPDRSGVVSSSARQAAWWVSRAFATATSGPVSASSMNAAQPALRWVSSSRRSSARCASSGSALRVAANDSCRRAGGCPSSGWVGS